MDLENVRPARVQVQHMSRLTLQIFEDTTTER